MISRRKDQSGAVPQSDIGPRWLVRPAEEVVDTIANTPTQHAFVTLGTKTLFLCHLTMYGPDSEMEPHMYQVILEAALPDWAEETYRSHRHRHPKETYFLGNSPRDLLTMPELNSRARTWFMADIFRGIPQQNEYTAWPWKGQKAAIANVRAEIKRIVHYRLFAPNTNYPETLTYLLFGAGDEAHMTNWQTKEPDFDHVLSLNTVPEWAAERELEAGIVIDFSDIPRKPASGKVHCTNPLPPGMNNVRYRGIPPLRSIDIGQTYWFCTRVANMNNPCPATCPPCASQFHP
jgi:hypothetical protein